MKYWFTLLLILIFNFSQAQKKGSNPFSLGLQYYNNNDIADAIPFFRNFLLQDPNHALAHYWLGRCYELTPYKEEALSHYLKAFTLNEEVFPDVIYRLANAYHTTLQFEEAIKYYKIYKKSVTPNKANELGSTLIKENLKCVKRIQECENGKLMLAMPYKHTIENIGKNVNTSFPEYTPAITADNKTMVFTSRRQGGTTDKKDKDNQFFEDVWMVKVDKNNQWGTPINIGAPINSSSHDACVSISPDGKSMFLYKTNNGGDIYFSEYKEGKWTTPTPFKPVNSPYKEPSITITADGKTIYFSSDRPGGLGGLDIYRIIKDKDGEWGEPINLGSSVNTEYDEDSPFISYDGYTLYFSSTGHHGMGGYDIFSTAYDGKKKMWKTPLNLGYPINSPDDDIYYVITGDKKTAYYASAKKDGYGDKDIYVVKMDSSYITKPLPALAIGQKPDEYIAKIEETKKSAGSSTSAPATLAKAGISHTKLIIKVTDAATRKPLSAKISIKKIHTLDIPIILTTPGNGIIDIKLEDGYDYALDVQADGYIFYSDNLDLIKVYKDQDYIENIELYKPEKGRKIILKNVFYESGSASLQEDSFDELRVLKDFLVKNPSIKVEIAGHTDNIGQFSTNLSLSEARAYGIYKTLVKWGIPENRMRYKGYGETKPIASNATPEGRQMNRRTEFEIIE